MTSKHRRESGLLSLEACISLTFFIFLMLFMYSFFVIFEARNEIGHVLLSTANSMSLDGYANKQLGSEDKASVQSLLYKLIGCFYDSDGEYTNDHDWYNDEQKDVVEVAETRFLAYLSGGDEDEAERILESLHVVRGGDGDADSSRFSGLDFSESKVEDGDLYLVVTYKLEYEYQVFNLGTLSFKQSCCSKLWNK